MKLITKRDLIRNIVEEWENICIIQLCPNKHLITEKLKKLDLETATADDISNIIGNSSWTSLVCDSCENESEAVIMLGSEFEYIESSITICTECIYEANKLIANEKL